MFQTGPARRSRRFKAARTVGWRSEVPTALRRRRRPSGKFWSFRSVFHVVLFRRLGCNRGNRKYFYESTWKDFCKPPPFRITRKPSWYLRHWCRLFWFQLFNKPFFGEIRGRRAHRKAHTRETERAKRRGRQAGRHTTNTRRHVNGAFASRAPSRKMN